MRATTTFRRSATAVSSTDLISLARDSAPSDSKQTSGPKSLLPWDFGGHSRYFTPESESLNNIGQIIVGDRSEVTLAPYEYNKEAGNYAYRSSIYYDPERHRDGDVVEREPEW